LNEELLEKNVSLLQALIDKGVVKRETKKISGALASVKFICNV
jgi:hypothetical protein